MITFEHGEVSKSSVVSSVLKELKNNHYEEGTMTNEKWIKLISKTKKAIDEVIDDGGFSSFSALSSSELQADLDKVIDKVINKKDDFDLESKVREHKAGYLGMTKQQFLHYLKQANVKTEEDYYDLLQGIKYRVAWDIDKHIGTRLRRLEEYYVKHKEELNKRGIKLNRELDGQKYHLYIDNNLYVFNLTNLKYDSGYGVHTIYDLTKGTSILKQIEKGVYAYGERTNKKSDAYILIKIIKDTFDLRKTI